MRTPKNQSKMASGSREDDIIVCEVDSFTDKNELASMTKLGLMVVDVRWVLDCVSYYKRLSLSKYAAIP